MIFRPFLQDHWKNRGKRNYFFLFLLAFSLSGCTHSVSMAGMNHLKTEKSPYLRQHADNPVWWYAWGDDAFIRAKKENKLVFLSVGYSTCHWCHVMERESFSDPTVADALNRDFIAIKVDREERPDIDAIYMDAVQAMTGSGGWPMNLILTPDRVPFFGGTYFPKSQLLEVLGKISRMWRSDSGKIYEVAGNLERWIKEQKSEALGTKLTHEVFGTFLKTFESSFDQAQGGRQGQPKFVPSYELRVLLRIHRRTTNEKALQMVKTTLDHVARGGIYDHIGGGFHRYSTDGHWLVPHFEKMLYDEAALVRVYTEAFEVTHDPEYEAVVRETLDYVLRDMTSSDGAFYSAEDADSEGVEGKFYIWKENEIRGLLNKDEYSEFKKAYGVTSTGNFEDGTNILNLQTGFSKHDRSKVLQSAIGKLTNSRSKRVRPARDEKVLTSWNGLMISAVAEAGRVFDELKYKDAAAKAAVFILTKSKPKELLHRWIAGDSKYEAQAEDYAFFIDGLLSVYQAKWDPKFCLEAARLQEEQNALFSDQNSGAYFETTGKDKTLLRRGKNFLDNVIPSANSVTLLNLLRLSAFMMKREYLDRAGRLLSAFPKQAQSFPTAFPQMVMGLDYFLDRSKEVVIIGNITDPSTEKFVREVAAGFHPNRVIAVGSGGHELIPLLKNRPMKNGKATAYVCVGQVCHLPTTDPRKAHEIASQIEKISW